MGDGLRRRRARLWAWVYAALFDPENSSDTGTGEERTDESSTETSSGDQSDDR